MSHLKEFQKLIANVNKAFPYILWADGRKIFKKCLSFAFSILYFYISAFKLWLVDF